MVAKLCKIQKVKRLPQYLDSFVVVCFTYHCMLYVDRFIFMRSREWPTLTPHLDLIRQHLTNETTGSFAGSCCWLGLNASSEWSRNVIILGVDQYCHHSVVNSRIKLGHIYIKSKPLGLGFSLTLFLGKCPWSDMVHCIPAYNIQVYNQILLQRGGDNGVQCSHGLIQASFH